MRCPHPRLARRDSVGFLYFGIHPSGLIKLGFSINPFLRIRQVSPCGTMCPDDKMRRMPTALLGIMPGAIKQERAFHKRYSNGRSEWYEMGSEAVRAITEMPFQSVDPQFKQKEYRLFEQQCRNLWHMRDL
jgi:hypothetical protein